ncbi:hypothetical protein ACT4UM_25660 [Bacillus sp. SS-TM]
MKFLEEPSSDTTAILLTEQSHQILNTILSRLQFVHTWQGSTPFRSEQRKLFAI